jgi:hypothetical protein
MRKFFGPLAQKPWESARLPSFVRP